MNETAGDRPAERDERILVVDDRQPNVLLTRRILGKGGYTKVRSATDSRAALLLVHSWEPDLVLLDLHMPHMGGTEFIDKLRHRDHAEGSDGPVDPSRAATTPVLVLTADDDPAALARARRAGAADTLTKPIDAGELLAVVDQLLARDRPLV